MISLVRNMLFILPLYILWVICGPCLSATELKNPYNNLIWTSKIGCDQSLTVKPYHGCTIRFAVGVGNGLYSVITKPTSDQPLKFSFYRQFDMRGLSIPNAVFGSIRRNIAHLKYIRVEKLWKQTRHSAIPQIPNWIKFPYLFPISKFYESCLFHLAALQ